MKFGIVLPEDLQDRVALRDFVQAIEGLGFDHIVFPDHVIGGNPATHKINGPYTHESFFHEFFVTMGWIAALTERIELVSGVLILPQRQTALVAKQAAQVDLLSGGRLRLGVGVGWNQVEYDVLNEDFFSRGKRIEEQIAVLRELWTKPLVNFDGKWHKISDAGINPRSTQAKIPIWLGGWSEPVIKRLARLGDGWLLYAGLTPVGQQCLDMLWRECAAINRDPAEIGIQSWVFLNKSDVMAGANQKPDAHEIRKPGEWLAEARAWKAAGATHLDCWTMYGKLTTPDQHIGLAKAFIETMQEL